MRGAAPAFIPHAVRYESHLFGGMKSMAAPWMNSRLAAG